MRVIAPVKAPFLFLGFVAWSCFALGQAGSPPADQRASLADLHSTLKKKGAAEKAAAWAWAKARGVPFRSELPDGKVMELQRLGPNGPVFYITNNIYAADSISTDEVWDSPGLSLKGDGMTVGEWDSGRVLLEHPDLLPRATQMDETDDPPPMHSNHATHVAGTLIGSGGGNYPQAIGMAPMADLQAWDWNNDLAEMADAALAGLLVSNHSYAIAAGWIPYGQAEPNNWWWIGGPGDEDPNFGYYDAEAQALDQIANNAPHYLIVKAAGNDRWDIGPGPGETYTIVDQNGDSLGTSTQSRPGDCSQTGYDCLPGSTVAKNILTIGAVNDVNGGYLPLQGPASVQMTGFSSFGPTDDGRIKPDLVANGWLLFSTWGPPNYYEVLAGTSMAAPTVSGSLLLLQEHYQNLDPGGNFMRAATLKALAIHTADETGTADGPDYEYGWGLMNTRKAADVISRNGAGDHVIVESTRVDQPPENPDEVNFTVEDDGARVRVTLVWNDPAAAPVTPPTLDPIATMLVNDLDLRVLGNSSTHQPWVLNPLSPSSAATRGNNSRDNVEVVDFVAAAGEYTAQVTNQLGLQGGAQDYSLIVSVRPPAPVSTGLIIDEHFDEGTQPAGWTVETLSGIPWDFFTDGNGDFKNQTGSNGGYAMLYNQGVNDTFSSLILPPLDLSSTESILLTFNSYYSFGDGSESITVHTSRDGGSSWNLAHSIPVTNHFPTLYPLDLTNNIAGYEDARISFRFDSGFLGVGGFNWQVDAVQVEVYGGGSSGGEPPPPLELPGQADMPSPASGETGASITPVLSWVSAPTADRHSIYFGTSLDLDNGDFHGTQIATQFSPGTLAADTTYFWRVDEVNDSGTTPGVVWNFTTESATEPPPGPTSMHVVDIDMASEPQARNRWRAYVTVRLMDDEGAPVPSASVSGEWSNGANGSDTQTTDSQGWASFSKSNLKAGLSSVNFTVTAATHATLSYDSGANGDLDGDSDGSTIVVYKDAPPPPANEAPNVTITDPIDQQEFSSGLGITLAATASDAEDDNASLVIHWSINTEQVGTGSSISHNFPDGVHTITAMTTDSGGESASDSVSITVGDSPVATEVRVGALDDVSTASSRRWTAAARVTVLDSANQAVQGAVVSGSWSSGAKGGASCSTDGQGQCVLSKGNLKISVGSVSLVITDVSASGMSFVNSGPASIDLIQPQ